MPALIWRALAGRALAELLGRSQRVSNQRVQGGDRLVPRRLRACALGAPLLVAALGDAPQCPHGDEQGAYLERTREA